MGVVRQDDRYAGLLVYANKAFNGLFFLFNPVLLKFKVKAVPAEYLGKLFRFIESALIISRNYHLGDGSCDAPGEAYKPLAVLIQEFPVDSRLYVKALGKSQLTR
jgi:hypothetical protein